MSSPATHFEAGFTLLEAMVAMTLLAMIGTAAVGGLGFGIAVWERTEDVGAESAEAHVAAGFLRRVVAGAQPVRVRDGSRTPPVMLEGAPGRLGLVAPLPAQLADPAAHYVVITAEERDGAVDIVLRYREIGLSRPSIPPGAAGEILFEGLASARFRYYGPASDGTDHGWQPTWQGRAELPQLVALDLTTAGDRWERRSIVMRPAAGGLP